MPLLQLHNLVLVPALESLKPAGAPFQGWPGSRSWTGEGVMLSFKAHLLTLWSPAMPLLTGSIDVSLQVDSEVCHSAYRAGEGPQIALGSRPARRGLWQQQQSRTPELSFQWKIQQELHKSPHEWDLRGRCRWAQLWAAGFALCHASAAGGPGITGADACCMRVVLVGSAAVT